MRPFNQCALSDDDSFASFDIRQSDTASVPGDHWLVTAPGLIAFVILGVTLIVDVILFVVSMFFAATIFLAFVSLILLFVCCGLTILLCGIGAVTGLIGTFCTIRRPAGLTINLLSFLANAGAVGIALWLMDLLTQLK
jgi:hypothetical protein